MAKITICTLRIGEAYREDTKESSVNKQHYCSRHGYEFVEDASVYDSSREPAWSKLHLMLKLLSSTSSMDFLVWMDSDIFIMNLATPITSFIDLYMKNNDVHILTGRDYKMTNTGTIIVRNCDWSRKFLQAILDNKDYPPIGNWEQDSFQDLVGRNVLDAKKHVAATVHSEELNSYWYNYSWGDFLLHLAGCRQGGLGPFMKMMCPHRVAEDTDDTFKARMYLIQTGLEEYKRNRMRG